jgi:hypothetical protein
MRGKDEQQYEALRELRQRFNKLYAKTGRPSIAPEKFRDDRAILGGTHQDFARRRSDQRHAAQEKQENQESQPTHSALIANLQMRKTHV